MRIVLMAALIILFVAISTLVVYYFYCEKVKLVEAEINGKTISLEVADNFIKRQKGLSGRKNLEKDSGMLLVFSEIGKHSIWMKEMKFSIDIIWLRDKAVVYTVGNAQTATGSIIPTFRPGKDADMVLELNSGFIKENNVKIGDRIKIDNDK